MFRALLGRQLLVPALLRLTLGTLLLRIFARLALSLLTFRALLGRQLLVPALLRLALFPSLLSLCVRLALLLLAFGALLGGSLLVAELSLLALGAAPLSLLAGLALSLFAGLALLLLALGALLGRQLLVAALLRLACDPLFFSLLARFAFLLRTLGAPLGVLFGIATLQFLGRKHGCLAQLRQRLANSLIQSDLALDVRRCLAHFANRLAQPRRDLWQHVGPKEDQRDEENDEDLLKAEVQHGGCF